MPITQPAMLEEYLAALLKTAKALIKPVKKNELLFPRNQV